MNGDDDTVGIRLAGLLAAALREGPPDGHGGGGLTGTGERNAVAAFLVARDSGAHRTARTRQRDDWR